MKKALIVVVVLLILVCAAPFWVGLNVAARVEGEIAELKENPEVRVELTDYRKGWLSSEARLLVGFTDAAVERIARDQSLEPEAADVLRRKVPVEMTIDHGPLVMRGGASAVWAKMEARVDEAGLMGEPMDATFGVDGKRPVWRGKVDFSGEFTYRLDVPQARFGDAATTVVVQPSFIRGQVLEPNFFVTMEVPAIEVSAPDSIMRVEEVFLEGDIELRGMQLGQGRGSFGIERIEVEDPANPGLRIVDISGVEVESEMEVDAETGLAEGEVSYTIAGLRVAEVADIAELELTLGLAQWDWEATERLGNRMQAEEAAGRQGDAAALAPDEVRAVSHSEPYIEIERLGFNMDGEPFEASGRLQIRPPQTSGSMPPQQMWMEMVEMSAELEASKPLVTRMASQYFSGQLGVPVDEQQALGFLASFISQGLIEEVDDGYRTEFSMAKGAITINGNPFPPTPGGAPASSAPGD